MILEKILFQDNYYWSGVVIRNDIVFQGKQRVHYIGETIFALVATRWFS